ncbi:tautomerase family protein [Nonomuraea cypriaca]|nr:tautomerase family protein [Nonomuraea cypriaca]
MIRSWSALDHLHRKQRLYRTLADRLERAGVAGEDLFLSYMENGPDDWSFGFGRAQYVDGELPIPGRPPAST